MVAVCRFFTAGKELLESYKFAPASQRRICESRGGRQEAGRAGAPAETGAAPAAPGPGAGPRQGLLRHECKLSPSSVVVARC